MTLGYHRDIFRPLSLKCVSDGKMHSTVNPKCWSKKGLFKTVTISYALYISEKRYILIEKGHFEKKVPNELHESTYAVICWLKN